MVGKLLVKDHETILMKDEFFLSSFFLTNLYSCIWFNTNRPLVEMQLEVGDRRSKKKKEEEERKTDLR